MGKLTTICRAALPVALLLAGISSVQAKSYSLPDGNKVQMLNLPGGTTTNVLKLNIKNNTTSTININWEILSNTVKGNQGWDFSFCDLENCYIDIPAGGRNPIAAEKGGTYQADVVTNSNPGEGVIVVRIYEDGFEEEADTLYFGFNTTVGINESQAIASKLEMFPIPAVQNLQLKFEGTNFAPVQGSIINAAGQVMESFRFENGAAGVNIDVADLPVGTYILRLTDRKGLAVSRRFQKS